MIDHDAARGTGLLGVLCLDSSFTKPLGHLRHPGTFDHAVKYEVLTGVDIPRLLHQPGPELEQLLIERARSLEAQGVTMIAGSCGFMARYQCQVSRAVRVPVIMSSLVLLPQLARIYGGGAGLGILTAHSTALQQEHFIGAGWQGTRPSVAGFEQQREFRQVILEGRRDDLDMTIMTEEVAATTEQLMAMSDIKVILLECTDLSAFAPVVRRISQCPVYDIVAAIDMTMRAHQGLDATLSIRGC